jgi:NitT/TauT family transport system substrate-binding protein
MQRIGWEGILALAVTAGVSLANAASALASDAIVTSNGLKMDIPYNAPSIGIAPLWLAIDGKHFERYGITVTTEFVSQSPTIVASVLSGENIFANVGADAVINADLNGADLVILTADINRLLFAIEAGPTIHSVADLKGKKIGITQFGTTTDFIARYVLKKAGLDPTHDANIVPAGAQEVSLTVLEAGLVDADVLGGGGVLEAERHGFHAVADLTDYDLPFYTGVIIGRKSWVAAHRNDTLNMVRGYMEGVAIAATDKQATINAIAKYTRTNDKELLEGSYQMLQKELQRIPVPRPEPLKTALDSSPLPAAKNADPKSFIDPSFVDELQHDGFIDRLYK